MRVGTGGPAVGGSFAGRDPKPAAQYADGMNLCQYIGSSPVRYLDPSGTTIEPKGGITGSYSRFLSGSGDKNRFIYTCRCGWLDRTHFTWDRAYAGVYNNLLAVSKKKAGANTTVSPTYRGPIDGVAITYTVANVGRLAGLGREWKLRGEGLKYTTLGIFYSLFRTGEAHQMGNAGRLLALVSDRAETVYSLEDLSTNWVGLMISADLHSSSPRTSASRPASAPSTSPRETLLAKYCGTVLSTKQARCLYDEMTKEEKLQKNYSIHPVLFNSKRSAAACKNAKASDVFGEAAKAAIYYRTFVSVKKAVLRTFPDKGKPVPIVIEP